MASSCVFMHLATYTCNTNRASVDLEDHIFISWDPSTNIPVNDGDSIQGAIDCEYDEGNPYKVIGKGMALIKSGAQLSFGDQVMVQGGTGYAIPWDGDPAHKIVGRVVSEGPHTEGQLATVLLADLTQ